MNTLYLGIELVAAQRTFYGYNDMADAKALLEIQLPAASNYHLRP